ncbi:MAG: 4-hydroxy-tetrahydrodipicolinate synthase [Gammaproteobacteria bacterium]|nr:4-hydroxy-tetrahydrodipicolinate synthase [Gammaproteobacteria bacterium]MBT8105321.1 4-hydroxy-tetrahydrodipicolinate synthase [Gammaproteobacteria bacterium]MBT8106782.1 4-hydroxy-tetrahydrodipicolinate synthase [Gammaproteobacteria bacterium]NNK25335.1 4-hydroxy-tetrahydrodipicolinate synthase [Woeseiaceae bacterium]
MFTGSLVALVTPFDGEDRADHASLKRLIDFHVEQGSDGIVIAGTTGESPTLRRSEHIELIGRALDIADGRIPVIAGTGSNSTWQSIELSKAVADPRLAAYMAVVPYYNKPTQQGIYEHYMAIADAIDKPLLMYNVPGRTVADMLPETVARLATHGNIFGVKEATGDMDRLEAIRALVDDDFMIYSGDDFTALEFMERGGHGVVTVSGNVAPRQLASLCRLAREGKIDEARALDATLQPLNRMLFIESNPIPVKWVVSEMGLIEPHIRLPLTPFSAQYHDEMRTAMRTAGVGTGKNT